MPSPNWQPGEPAPWFLARTQANPRFCFDSMGGRYIVLTFFRSTSDPLAQQFFAALEGLRFLFDDENVCFFGVSIDPQDEALGRVNDSLPGVRFFFDTDFAVSTANGVGSAAGGYACATFILDERLRIVRMIPLVEDPTAHVNQIIETLRGLPLLAPPAAANMQAPVLIVPRVFEPEFCRKLIDFYNERGGQESGFMREVQGKTVQVFDYNHKRRRDEEITDEEFRRACMVRIHNRLVPELKKAFQFEATRIERYVVACYEAETAGHFRAHRDNTTKGTAHRRFAVSLMLNTGEYEGGEVCFPEYGRQRYAAPAGGAVVFSCSLLHEALPVTRGKRYVFLPFLYDESGAKIRQQNQQYLA